MFFKTMPLLLGAAALVAPAFCAEWMSDFEQAKAKAKAEKKALLVEFTGSDWCSACKKLHREVLDKKEFTTYAKDRFVLMEVDVPMDKSKISAELLKKNQELVARYHVDGYPTVLVMTANGKVAGGFMGAKSSMDIVKPLLDTGLDNVKTLKKAAKTKDEEAKLDMLIAVYKSMPDDIQSCAAALREDIVAKDKTDKLGQAREKAVAAQKADMEAKSVDLLQMKPKEMMSVVKEYEKKVYEENRVAFLQLKMMALIFNAESAEEMGKIKDVILKDAETLKRDKEEITEQVNRQFEDPAALFKSIQDYKKEQGM